MIQQVGYPLHLGLESPPVEERKHHLLTEEWQEWGQGFSIKYCQHDIQVSAPDWWACHTSTGASGGTSDTRATVPGSGESDGAAVSGADVDVGGGMAGVTGLPGVGGSVGDGRSASSTTEAGGGGAVVVSAGVSLGGTSTFPLSLLPLPTPTPPPIPLPLPLPF